MTYALESNKEVERLEKQSQSSAYDYKTELVEIGDLNGKVVVDAGCGSGIVSRYLAGKFPTAQVIACDASDIRIKQSQKLAESIPNIAFQKQDITALTFEDQTVDFLLSRFVLEHLSSKNQEKAIQEFYRCLKPNGTVCLVDIDGLFHNIFPIPVNIREGLNLLAEAPTIDLFIGRKLPSLLNAAGFSQLHWKVQVMSITNDALVVEKTLIKERFELGRLFFQEIFGSEKVFKDFSENYLHQLDQEGTTLFYTKWIVTGKKL